MTCQEMIALLSDYFDALCAADVTRRLEEHLHDCALCRHLRRFLLDQLRGEETDIPSVWATPPRAWGD